jgi:hypothetical protein
LSGVPRPAAQQPDDLTIQIIHLGSAAFQKQVLLGRRIHRRLIWSLQLQLQAAHILNKLANPDGGVLIFQLNSGTIKSTERFLLHVGNQMRQFLILS